MGKYIHKLPFGTVPLEVTIAYDLMTLGDMLNACPLEYYDPYFSGKFPSSLTASGNGVVKRSLYLIPFFKDRFCRAEAVTFLQSLNLQLAKAEDLLTLLHDHTSFLVSQGVDSILEYGTEWLSGHNVPIKTVLWARLRNGSRQLRPAFPEDPWDVERTYILAVAEDGMRRKIHQTPLPGSIIPTSKPRTAKLKSLGVFPSATIGVPGAVTVKVMVHYGKSKKDLLEETGCAYSDISNLVVGRGKPSPEAQTVKRTIFLVPLTAFGHGSNNYPTEILRYLDKHNLQPAYAEDLLALVRDHRSALHSNKRYELMVLGNRPDGQCLWVSYDSNNTFTPGSLRINDANGGYRGSFWTLATLKPKSK